MAARWRNAAGKIASLAMIFAITAVSAEGILELMLRFPGYIPNSMMPAMRQYYYAEDQRYIQYLPDCAKYDRKLTYTLKPGSCRFSGREFDTTVTINSLGVRDNEQSLQAPEIFVLGDSIAMGWGVEDDETFASIVENETGIKVLNLAVSSYGTVREFDISNRADASRLNTLIVQYSHNDLEENKTFVDHGNKLPISGNNVYETTRRQHLDQTKYFAGKHVLWLVRRLVGSLFASAHAQERADEAKYFFSVLFTKFDELSQRAKLAPHSTLVIVQRLPWPAEISRAALARAQPRPDAISRLFVLGYPTRRGSGYPLDQHMTAIGHREVGEQIIKIVRDKCYLVREVKEAEAGQQFPECRFFLDEL
ncbi:SGNH/GDSL hydrolase family protein [Taklimakanibacter lacteus]|uniref:SGNH/GDSL hydrolase family protein n=1 Tax=Taklimakanibacter lacteus TaxID=2268456 RepID=UPI000E66295D